jgi:hypothetical protein
MLTSHKRNSFPNFPRDHRRVGLTNYKPVIRRSASAKRQCCSTGTDEVVVVGCDASPWRSNFWPLAMPPT